MAAISSPGGGTIVRGLVVGQQGIDTALVQLASERDMRRLVQSGPRTVNVAQVSSGGVAIGPNGVAIDPVAIMGGPIYARAADGEFHEVGFVTQLEVTRDMLDTTVFGGDIQFTQGLMRVTGSFRSQL